MRRFYREATVQPADGGHRILLDGRPVRSPARHHLVVPTVGLAAAIASEWAAQGETIAPARMYLTQLANTAIDRVAIRRDEIVRATAAYGETDLLCHRAAFPADLVERQTRGWQPLLDWAAQVLDARLTVTRSVIPVDQPRQAIAAIGAVVGGLDDYRLTGLHVATGILGSVVLGLALLHGRLDAAAGFAAAQLDEDFQAERWGVDSEAAARREAIAAELAAVQRLFQLLDGWP